MTAWAEIEATVKYMVENPATAERMMPHLRRAVERRCGWRVRGYHVRGFLFGLGVVALACAIAWVLNAMAQPLGLWALIWRWAQ